MKVRLGARILSLVVLAGLVAGCDRCTGRPNLNAPSLPLTCGANADPAK